MFVCLMVLESVISDNLPSEVWCEAGNYNLGPGPSSESVWPGLSRSQTSIEASKTNLATLGLPRSSRGSCITGWRRGQVWAWCLYWWESVCTKCTQASSLLPSSHVSHARAWCWSMSRPSSSSWPGSSGGSTPSRRTSTGALWSTLRETPKSRLWGNLVKCSGRVYHFVICNQPHLFLEHWK